MDDYFSTIKKHFARYQARYIYGTLGVLGFAVTGGLSYGSFVASSMLEASTVVILSAAASTACVVQAIRAKPEVEPEIQARSSSPSLPSFERRVFPIVSQGSAQDVELDITNRSSPIQNSTEDRVAISLPVITNALRLEKIGFDGDIPYDFICPISYDIMDEPVRLSDNQYYERGEILKLLHHNPDAKCPQDRNIKIIEKHQPNIDPFKIDLELKNRITFFVAKLENDYQKIQSEEDVDDETYGQSSGLSL